MNLEIEHVLKGWHLINPNLVSERLKNWVNDRKNALREAMKSVIIGGKDVANLMIKKGYMDLPQQLVPIRSKAPIRTKSLKNCEFVFLSSGRFESFSADFKRNHAVQGITEYTVGVVDKRLRVRSFMIQTPTMRGVKNIHHDRIKCHFDFEDTITDEWLQTLKNDVYNKVQLCANQLGQPSNIYFGLRELGIPIPCGHKPPVFTEQGSKLTYVPANLARPLKLALSGKVQLTTHESVTTGIFDFKIEQIQLWYETTKVSPMFIETDED